MNHRVPSHRKVTPKVRNGKVREKDRRAETPSYWNSSLPTPVIDKRPPGKGYKHFLRPRDIIQFIELLPDWPVLSHGLNAVILAPGRPFTDGSCSSLYGVVELYAWEETRWSRFPPEAYHDHHELLNRLGVSCENRKTHWLCKFTAEQIRAYQLLHVFLHELGHHRDRMTTRKQHYISRGEGFAEDYAKRNEKLVWDRYCRAFGFVPASSS